MTGSWPTFSETEQHERIRDAIRERLGSWRRFVIAVDGVDGVGKSNFARYLAWKLGMPAIETDLYFDRREDLTYDLGRLRAVVEARSSLDRPVIIEGLRILYILQELNVACDFRVWVEQDGRHNSCRFHSDLEYYRTTFNPIATADAVFRRPTDDRPGDTD